VGFGCDSAALWPWWLDGFHIFFAM